MKRTLLLIMATVSVSIYSQVGINTANPQGTFHIDGLGDNPTTGVPTIVQQSNDFTVTQNGNVGIGTTVPNASAILDVNVDGLDIGSKKGFLGPKVALTSRTDQSTIPSPVAGLLVYNLGTAGLHYNGYVFWDGIEWRTFNNSTLLPGVIEALNCNNAQLTPRTYITGIPYTGTMTVPYTGGNGGAYPAQTVGPVNGLTATLSAGNFALGSGSLSYVITGIPTVTSPAATVFSLNIGGQNCSASVGADGGIVTGDLIHYKASMPSTPAGVWLSSYVADLPVLDGKLRLDAYFNASSSSGNGSVTMYPRLVNISTSPVKLWFSAMTTVNNFNAGNYLLAPSTPVGSGTSLRPSAYVELDNGIYYNLGLNDKDGINTPRITGSGQGANQEVVTVDLSFDGKWYRIYYFPTVDNKNTNSTADDTREIFLSIQRLY
jgi:hypothetical protein